MNKSITETFLMDLRTLIHFEIYWDMIPRETHIQVVINYLNRSLKFIRESGNDMKHLAIDELYQSELRFRRKVNLEELINKYSDLDFNFSVTGYDGFDFTMEPI